MTMEVSEGRVISANATRCEAHSHITTAES